MANTKQYLSHLLQNTGITPACSEEEREAANVIAKIFADHGFTPEMQEFSASGMTKVAQAILVSSLSSVPCFAALEGPLAWSACFWPSPPPLSTCSSARVAP